MNAAKQSSAERRGVNQVRGFLMEQFARRAEKPVADLGRLAAALHLTSQQLEGNVAAPYLGRAADSIDQVASLLKNANTDDMLRALEDFARRQPLLFVGSALVVGIGAARFFKSSALPAEAFTSPAAAPRHRRATRIEDGPNRREADDQEESQAS